MAHILPTSMARKQKPPTTPAKKRLDEIVRKEIKKVRVLNEKRMAELGDAYRSPYYNRIVSLYEPLLDCDKTIIIYLLVPIIELNGLETCKIVFESFHPTQYIASNGVEDFVDVLNFEEKKGTKTHHHTSSSYPPDAMYGTNLSDDEGLRVFGTNLEDVLIKYEVKKLETVNHFFCICFHLKTGQIELNDNSKIKEAFSKRYKGLPEKLVLVLYLLILERKSTAKRRIKKLEKAKIKRKEVEWRTLQNGVDCGTFAMRHMEMYKGKSPWNQGFVNEDKKDIQDSQLRFLRYRYLSKIVLSGYNFVRNRSL
ncbi:putative papain-like cysteine peptidase superfamily [Helianthus anomalus]